MRNELDFNESFFKAILQSSQVQAMTRTRAEKAAATARANAPYDSGAYQKSIRVTARQGRARVTHIVEATDHKALLIESRTGNLARALKATR